MQYMYTQTTCANKLSTFLGITAPNRQRSQRASSTCWRTDSSVQSDNDIRGICGLSQSVNYLATALKSMKSIKEWLNQMKTAVNG